MKCEKSKKVILTLALLINIFSGADIVYSQTRKSVVPQSDIEFYEYFIGSKLAASFSEKCQVFTGIVNKFDGQTINFAIQQSLYGIDITGNRISLKYKLPRRSFPFGSEGRSAWDYVEVQEGKELLVTRCLNNSGLENYKVIVADQKYFPSVIKTVLYKLKLEKNPRIILNAPKLLAKENDFVFASYLTSELRSRRGEYSDDAAKTFSRLLKDDNYPTFLRGLVSLSLNISISRTGESALSSEARKLVVKNIVKTASGNGKAVEEAIKLLINLSEKKQIDINSFLSKNERRDLSRNYQRLSLKNVSEQGRKKFERQLAGN